MDSSRSEVAKNGIVCQNRTTQTLKMSHKISLIIITNTHISAKTDDNSRLILWVWVVRFWQIIPFFATSEREESIISNLFMIWIDLVNKSDDVIMTSSHSGKTGQSMFLILAKIYSQYLKNNFKKGFSHEYFQKS